MVTHIYIKSIDQPGKVASPARGQLNRKMNISLSAFVPENLVSRDGFGSPVPRQPVHLHTQAESGAYLRDSSRAPRRRPYRRTIERRAAASTKNALRRHGIMYYLESTILCIIIRSLCTGI